MILVTVGSTHFDLLIKKIDQLVDDKIITDNVVCQIGNGEYLPKSCQFYRFNPTIAQDFESADLVISHGGATVLQIIKMNKPLIAIANTALQDDHQTLFLRQLAKHYPIRWSNDLSTLPELLRQPEKIEKKPENGNDIAFMISQYTLANNSTTTG